MARLTKNDWLDHGLRTLEAHGFTSLKADRLAKSLGVSRGSFYWHFEDLAAFHTAVLNHWLEVSVLAVVKQFGDIDHPPGQKLGLLIERAAAGPRGLEQAVRAWAFNEPAVRTIVAEVDRQRMAFIAELLEAHGLDREPAQRRALLIYLSAVGYNVLGDTFEPALEESAVQDLIAFAVSP